MQSSTQVAGPFIFKAKLERLHTYCIYWANNNEKQLAVKLLNGTAELLGAELMPRQPIHVQPGSNLHIFTWDGCYIYTYSESYFTADHLIDVTLLNDSGRESPMIFYLDLHYQLTIARRTALENSELGPRILMIGEQKQYKLDICRTLLNYASKLNMEPIFVDLDLENSAFCDGCITACHIKGRVPANLMLYNKKIVYYYGGTKINKKIYVELMQTLAQTTMDKLNKYLTIYKEKGLAEEYPPFCSGLIIHMPSLKYLGNVLEKELLQEVIKMFDITHALALEDVNIMAYLKKYHPNIKRFSIPKLESIRYEAAKMSKIDLYFNGLPGQSIYKRTVSLSLEEVKCYEVKFGEDNLPYCIQLNLSEMNIVKSVITILHAKNEQIDDGFSLASKALTSPVCCMARIHSIENGKIDLLAIEDKFLEMHKNSLWVMARIA